MRGLKRLRERVDAMGNGRARRYSAEMRAELLDAVEMLRERGESWDRTGELLGVSCETLRRWWHEAQREEAPVRSLVPVQVTELSSSNGVVVMPNGTRVEGLDVAAVAELLRALS